MLKTYTLKKIDHEIVLKGIVQKQVLMNTKVYPWFNSIYNTYQPDQKYISLLKPVAHEIKVLIIAGSWCDDTKRELPAFYKVAKEIGLNENQIELIMVDKNKKCNNLNINIIEVTHIPAFIFYKDGKERGRIIEKTSTNIEQDLAEILKIKPKQ